MNNETLRHTAVTATLATFQYIFIKKQYCSRKLYFIIMRVFLLKLSFYFYYTVEKH